MARLRPAIAMDENDAVRPLVDGTVRPEGIGLNVRTVTGAARHARLRQHRELDGAGCSIGSYLLGRARGVEDLAGIPPWNPRPCGT